MEKARTIWRDKILQERKIAFEKNDILIRDAQIDNDQDLLKIALTRRDELRAVGDKINAATNVVELKATLEIINKV
jgi:hypothetical protein